MQGTVLYDPGNIRFEDRETPRIEQPTDAVIRIAATCVCGSDLWRYVVFGSGHMDHLCGEYLEHYHTERPHQGIENELLVKGTRGPLEQTISLSKVRSSERLGGLLRSY